MTRSPRDRLRLGGFVTAGPGAAWRHPASEQYRFLEPSYYQEIARTLERGKFDLIFFANKLSLPGRTPEAVDSSLRGGGWGVAHPDPLLLLVAIATATERLGLASTISTSYEAPFNVARAVATLDHLSKGRACWNVVTSTQDAEAQNFGLDEQRERVERYDIAEEFLRVVHGLWDTWEDDAVLLDRVTGTAVDPAKVHALNHEGKYFRVRGPLNMPRPPQGYPVIAQAGASDEGRDFAARWSELIFTPQPFLKVAKSFYDDIKSRAVNHGRDPNDIKVLPGVTVVVGETETILREKEDILRSLSPRADSRGATGAMLELDLSQVPNETSASELLAGRRVSGMQGHADALISIVQERNLTVGELKEFLSNSVGTASFAKFAGTPSQVADQMEEWFQNEGCDGFIVRPTYLPGTAEEFVRLVVPELQRRNLFRKEYEGATLRENLGLSRPSRGRWQEQRSEAARRSA